MIGFANRCGTPMFISNIELKLKETFFKILKEIDKNHHSTILALTMEQNQSTIVSHFYYNFASYNILVHLIVELKVN